MLEMNAQVDLSHPADRVWHALTDQWLLGRWFTEAEAVKGSPGRLLLHTAALPGFDAAVEVEVIDRSPELITAGCHEAGRRSRLTCAVTPTAEGCRVSVRETLEHGVWPEEQRLRREQCCQQALTVRLPAILDWLAFQQVDLRRGEVTMTSELPVTEAFDDPPAPVERSRRPLLVAALAGLALAGGAAVWAVLPTKPERVAGPDPVPVSTTATPTARPAPATRSARPTRTAATSSARPSRTSTTATPNRSTTSAPPAAAALTARYETVSTRLLGYTGQVEVANPGTTAATGWTVVVTLAEGGTVTGATGADWRQDEEVVTFTGRPVRAGQSQTFEFDVRDADPSTRRPEGCTVGDDPCAGL